MRLLTLLLWGFFARCEITHVHAAEPAVPGDVNWSLKIPAEDTVVYHGTLNLEGAGRNMGSMLYVAPNVVGLFAALITHGVIMGAARDAEKSRAQEAADRVLTPYKSLLANYTYRELAQQALEKSAMGGTRRVAEPAEPSGNGLVVEIAPVFAMTQDQTAIVMDDAIAIYPPGNSQKPLYTNVIRVVSRTETSTDLVNHWTSNEGAALKAVSAGLLAESVDLALGELSAKLEQGGTFRTVRYTEGRDEMMERGQVIKEHCDRIILKNLRGWIISVSVKQGAATAATSCGSETPQ